MPVQLSSLPLKELHCEENPLLQHLPVHSLQEEEVLALKVDSCCVSVCLFICVCRVGVCLSISLTVCSVGDSGVGVMGGNGEGREGGMEGGGTLSLGNSAELHIA